MNTAIARTWPIWPYQLFLSILFFGPPVAALFIASNVAIMTDLGWLARSVLTTYVCPTPAKSYQLLDAPMAVCVRCWGATIGLWVGWFAVGSHTTRAWLKPWLALPWWVRLATALVPFGLWWLEINAWASADYTVLLINGIVAGTAAGIFFCSIWPGLLSHRD
jgi:hypothetical protein